MANRTPSFAYSLEARDPHGLDPKKYQVLLVVHRRDDEPISDKDAETIEATLAPHSLPKAPPPAARTTKKTAPPKAAAPAKKRRAG